MALAADAADRLQVIALQTLRLLLQQLNELLEQAALFGQDMVEVLIDLRALHAHRVPVPPRSCSRRSSRVAVCSGLIWYWPESMACCRRLTRAASMSGVFCTACARLVMSR